MRRSGQRVAEERLRIAREMHYVVAHSLGAVAIQAGVAEHQLTQVPENARRPVSTSARRRGLPRGNAAHVGLSAVGFLLNTLPALLGAGS
jgi:hypothetical protein